MPTKRKLTEPPGTPKKQTQAPPAPAMADVAGDQARGALLASIYGGDAGTVDCQAKALNGMLEPFPPSQIGKLPRVKKWAKGKEKKQTCDVCGGWHEPSATHLDYVGHANATIRLLAVDPFWQWEPVKVTDEGFPQFIHAEGKVKEWVDGQPVWVTTTRPVGLWIRLTVLGVTRLGFGSVEFGVFDPEKQLIGDAIRNAAMRFGLAVQLWAKGETQEVADSQGQAEPAGQDRTPTPEPRKDRPASKVSTPEVMCSLCGTVTPTDGLNVFPSKYAQHEIGIKEGDPIYRCPDCGKYVGAVPAPKPTTGEDAPQEEVSGGESVLCQSCGVDTTKAKHVQGCPLDPDDDLPF